MSKLSCDLQLDPTDDPDRFERLLALLIRIRRHAVSSVIRTASRFRHHFDHPDVVFGIIG
jgi:hypothetical protein